MKNAIGYIRVSTEEQGSDDKYGIDTQKQAIHAYASANGYGISDWCIDKISGVKDNRPEFDKIATYVFLLACPSFQEYFVILRQI